MNSTCREQKIEPISSLTTILDHLISLEILSSIDNRNILKHTFIKFRRGLQHKTLYFNMFQRQTVWQTFLLQGLDISNILAFLSYSIISSKGGCWNNICSRIRVIPFGCPGRPTWFRFWTLWLLLQRTGSRGWRSRTGGSIGGSSGRYFRSEL